MSKKVTISPILIALAILFVCIVLVLFLAQEAAAPLTKQEVRPIPTGDQPSSTDFNSASPPPTADGRFFALSLDSNPSTGYSWIYEISEPDLVQIKQDYLSPCQDEMLTGCGGREVFTLEALQTGTLTLTLRYARPWESAQPLETRFYDFTIDEHLHIQQTASRIESPAEH